MQAAVKTAKEDLKNKSNELLMIQKQLAQEQKVGRGGEGGEVSTCPRQSARVSLRGGHSRSQLMRARRTCEMQNDLSCSICER